MKARMPECNGVEEEVEWEEGERERSKGRSGRLDDREQLSRLNPV
jgi:hypothetical protein